MRNQNEPQGTPSLPKKPTLHLKCATPAGTSAALAERWQLWTRCEICGHLNCAAVQGRVLRVCMAQFHKLEWQKYSNFFFFSCTVVQHVFVHISHYVVHGHLSQLFFKNFRKLSMYACRCIIYGFTYPDVAAHILLIPVCCVLVRKLLTTKTVSYIHISTMCTSLSVQYNYTCESIYILYVFQSTHISVIDH